jgi:hypothetical protein
MKKIILPILALCISIFGQAQKDTSISTKKDAIIIHSNNIKISTDTITIGGIIIVNKKVAEKNNNWKTSIKISDTNSREFVGDFKKTRIQINRTKRPLKNVSTSFFDLDLGFANYIDNSESRYYIMNNQILPQNNTAIFPGPPASAILKLNNLKSSNVNIWLVQQRVNLYQHKLSLKYGIGFEMYNFRFEESVSLRDEYPYINTESIDFRKNKLFVKYLTVPFQINYRPNPNSKKGFYAGIGLSAGYLLKARTKQISAERGKQKIGGNFNLNDWRTAAIGELGIGAVRLYGSYGFSNLFADNNLYGFDFNPFAIGIRLNKF